MRNISDKSCRENQKNEIGRKYSTYGERRGVCRILVGKHKEKRSLIRPWHR